MIGRRRLAKWLVLPALAPASAWADDDTQLAAAVMRRLAAEPPRAAAFVEEKRLQSLTVPLVSRGRLLFTPASGGRPARLEQVTETPQPERMVIEGDAAQIETPGQPARTLGLDEVPGLRALADALRSSLAGDLSTLSQLFTVAASGSLGQWRLMLVPRDAALRAQLARVTLDGAGAQLRQVTIQSARETDVLALTPLPPQKAQ